jgi:hypothetical protein
VDSVGSDGVQLNRVLDAVAALVRLDARWQPLKEEDRRALDRLLDLADAADKAAKQVEAGAS